MLRTLNGKLSALLLGLFVAYGLLHLALSLYTTRLFLDEATQKLNLPLAGHVVTQRTLMRNGRADEAAARQLFAAVMAVNPMAELYLLDARGTILAFSAKPDDVKRQTVSLEPILRLIGGTQDFPVFGDDPRHESRRKVFSVAQIPPPPRAGTRPVPQAEGYLYIVIGGEQFDSVVAMLLQSQILRWGAWVTTASLLFAALAGLLALRMLTVRIRRLALTMDGFRRSGFAAPVTTRFGARRHPDEVDQLGATFEEMAVRISAQLERLRQTDQQRRELVANVSHDLRTPLTALQGYLETVTLKGDSLAPQERQQYLELAAGQGQRLARLVSNLFELAKLESTEKALELEVFSACDLVQDVVEKFQLAAGESGIALTAGFENDLPRVRGDLQLIERLLENLIENALRFTPVGGRVDVLCRPHADKMVIEVRDSGTGIPPEDLPFIFDRFYRGRTAASGSTDGAGLGLAISKRIADMHGETLTVENPPGGGASFVLTLPRADG